MAVGWADRYSHARPVARAANAFAAIIYASGNDARRGAVVRALERHGAASFEEFAVRRTIPAVDIAQRATAPA